MIVMSSLLRTVLDRHLCPMLATGTEFGVFLFRGTVYGECGVAFSANSSFGMPGRLFPNWESELQLL